MRDGQPGNWWVRWRTFDGEGSSTFDTEEEAEVFAADLRLRLHRGTFVSPSRGRRLFGDFAASWVPSGRPSTARRDLDYLRARVAPKWGRYPLGDIARPDIERWADELGRELAPATVQKCVQVLRKVLRAAVRDGVLSTNPADGVSVPVPHDAEPRFLTSAEEAVGEVSDRYRPLVPFLADVGLRIGEAAALRWQDVDVDRGVVRVREVLTEPRGRRTFGPPKTGKGRLSVPTLTPEVGLVLEDRRRAARATAQDFVWAGPSGDPMSPNRFRSRVWRPALPLADLAEPQPTPHGLRHTAVTRWVAADVDLYRASRYAGHRDTAFTARVYGHLYDEDASSTRAAMSAMRTAAAEDAEARAEVISLTQRRRALVQ
jgi:integrase